METIDLKLIWSLPRKKCFLNDLWNGSIIHRCVRRNSTLSGFTMPQLLRQYFSGIQTQWPIIAVFHSRIFCKDSVASSVFHNLWGKIGNWWKNFWYFSCRTFARWFFWKGCICPVLWRGRAFGNGLCKLASPGGKRAVFGRAAGLCLPLALAVPGFSHPTLRGTSQRKLMTNLALGLLLPVYPHIDPGNLLPVVL